MPLVAGYALAESFKDHNPKVATTSDEHQVWVEPLSVFPLLEHLKSAQGYEFDYLSAITAVDYIEYFELVYHLRAIKSNQTGVVKTRLYDRENPSVESVTTLWRGAELQEREIWDLMGISFQGHPNLKRVMLWEGFPGHPHRKDHMGG